MNPPGGSHPAKRYEAAHGRHRAEADALEARARSVEIARLGSFALAAVAWLVYDEIPVPAALTLSIAVIATAGFVALVVRHRSLRVALRRARIAEVLARLGLLRLARDWDGLADAYEEIGYEDPLLDAEAVDEHHPYGYDLDIFGPQSVRALLGPTPTPTGTGTLRAWLSEPAPPEEVERRQSAVAALARDAEGRDFLTGEALLIDRVDREGWRRFLEWCEGPSVFGGGTVGGADAASPADVAPRGAATVPVPDAPAVLPDAAPVVPRWSVHVARILPPLTFVLFLYWLFSVGTSALVWLGPLVVQATLALRWRRAFAVWFDRAGARAPGLRRHHGLLSAWEAYPTDDPTLQALQARLTDRAGARASKEIRNLERWLDLASSAGSMVHEIVVVLFFWDVHVAVGLDRWRQRAGASVSDWFDALGELEALSALAVLAHDQPAWCYPTVSDAVDGYEATALGHPLLPDDLRRASDVRLDPPGRFLLVTGSNMSGKSTLLRSIGLGAVMAQTGSVVCASEARLPPLRTFTSMRIHDSLTGGVSLFMAELLRLKALVDAADEPDPRALLYLVDEVLQGTNSEERRVAARRIIHHLLDANAIGAVTTHDLALHEDHLLDERSTKVHFREHVDDTGGEVLTFDYRLRPGLATSRNALRLLRIVGLDSGGDGGPEPARE